MTEHFHQIHPIKEEFHYQNEYFTCALDDLNTYNCLKCPYFTHMKIEFDSHNHKFERQKSAKIFKKFTCYKCRNFHSYSRLLFMKHKEKCQVKETVSKKDSVAIWYKCEQCPFESLRRKETKSHSKCAHFSEKICCKCQFCGHTTQRPFTMRRHIFNNHMSAEDVTWFKCTQCPYKAKFKHLLKQHLFIKHTDGPFEEFRCEKCSYVSNRKNNLLTHVKYIHMPPEKVVWLKCDQCMFVTKWSFDLKRHKRLKHCPSEIKWLKCDLCSYKTKYNDHLKLHVLSKHTDPNLIEWAQCDFCDFKTKNKSNLKKHISSRHKSDLLSVEDEKWLLCDRCPYRTRYTRSLNEHVVSNHTNSEQIQWFPCDQCSFKAKLRSYLRKHVKRLHSNPEDIVWEKCGFCDFRTKYKIHLRKHVKRKHDSNVGEFVCEQCGLSMESSGTLKNHVRIVHAKLNRVDLGQ